jgi:hypothetical protein
MLNSIWACLTTYLMLGIVIATYFGNKWWHYILITLMWPILVVSIGGICCIGIIYLIFLVSIKIKCILINNIKQLKQLK